MQFVTCEAGCLQKASHVFKRDSYNGLSLNFWDGGCGVWYTHNFTLRILLAIGSYEAEVGGRGWGGVNRMGSGPAHFAILLAGGAKQTTAGVAVS